MYLLRTNQHIHILLRVNTRVLQWLKRTLMTRLSSFTLDFPPSTALLLPPFPVPVQIPCQFLNRADTFLLRDFCSWLFPLPEVRILTFLQAFLQMPSSQ